MAKVVKKIYHYQQDNLLQRDAAMIAGILPIFQDNSA
jgi:hypothetical protein